MIPTLQKSPEWSKQSHWFLCSFVFMQIMCLFVTNFFHIYIFSELKCKKEKLLLLQKHHQTLFSSVFHILLHDFRRITLSQLFPNNCITLQLWEKEILKLNSVICIVPKVDSPVTDFTWRTKICCFLCHADIEGH